MTRALAVGLVAVAAVAAVAACGGDDSGTPDAGSGQNRLEVLDPPGDSIGLAFSGREDLRVRYLDPAGLPLAGAPVAVELVAGPTEAVAGSTLSAPLATTDAAGIATIEVRAGGARANFRVRARAESAPPVLFYVTVSNDGFAALAVTPEHRGYRPAAAFSALELRLYATAELACAGFAADAPAESVLPPRTLAGFGGTAHFPTVEAGRALTLVVWTVAARGERALSVGCTELPASTLRAGEAVALALPVDDRAAALPAAFALTSRIETAALVAATAPSPDPWQILACPLGPAQLLIDCALDGAAPDGELDCVPTATGALVDAIAARRGPLAAGCRPAQVGAPATPSLDQLVADELDAPFAGPELDTVLDGHAAPLAAFQLVSRLEFDGPVARHRLERAVVTLDGADHEVDLVASLRPIIAADLAVNRPPGRLALAAHGFTLRYGEIARAAFDALGLEPVGLAGQADALGQALVAAMTAGPETGCAALSRVACSAAGLADACLAAGCGAAKPVLDQRLAAWLGALAVSGVDLELAASAELVDDDLDLVAEALGGQGGEWSCALSTSAEPVVVSGDLAGTAAP